ncbi:MAG TPA: hypothetical protein VFZ49_07400, partial [Pyrinomonadaceae bacterium]
MAENITDVSFANDIRPLFRDSDIDTMIKVRKLDLSNFEQVSSAADSILKRLAAGEMPCDAPWPEKDIDTFRQWIADGKRP